MNAGGRRWDEPERGRWRAFPCGVLVLARREHRLGMLATALLCACATVDLPKEVRLASLKPATEQISLVDARPVEPRDELTHGRGYVRSYLADDAVRPRAIDLVASRLADALPVRYRDRAVELRRLDVGFLVSPNVLPTSSDTTLSLPPGTSGSVAALAVLLGYAWIAVVNGPRHDTLAVAAIDVWVDDRPLQSARTTAITREMGPASALESALAAALDDLAQQARDLPRTPGSMRR